MQLIGYVHACDRNYTQLAIKNAEDKITNIRSLLITYFNCTATL